MQSYRLQSGACGLFSPSRMFAVVPVNGKRMQLSCKLSCKQSLRIVWICKCGRQLCCHRLGFQCRKDDSILVSLLVGRHLKMLISFAETVYYRSALNNVYEVSSGTYMSLKSLQRHPVSVKPITWIRLTKDETRLAATVIVEIIRGKTQKAFGRKTVGQKSL
jgi:hypothetical protein